MENHPKTRQLEKHKHLAERKHYVLAAASVTVVL